MKNKLQIIFNRHFVPPFLWAMLILFLTGISSKNIPDEPFINFDKIVHIILFLIFTVSIIVAIYKQSVSKKIKYYAFFTAILISISYGALTELLQLFIFNGRKGEVSDFISNAIGSIISPFIFKILYKE